jgi:MYXO-CTERM domain-containing protein
MRRSDLTAAAAALSLLLSADLAGAYCRTSSCDAQSKTDAHTGQVCTPKMAGDCGTVISWAQPCVGWSLQKAASKKGITFAQAEQVFKDAFARWTSAMCSGGGTPLMTVNEATPANCDKHEYNQMVGNANIIMFRDDAWPYEGSSNTLALTTVTYNLDTGEIYDADMELNSADVNFTIDDTNVEYDLPSIATHETGHFLGLAHSPLPDATMFPDYTPHSTNLRDLSADDIAGICAIYPPGTPPSSCDDTPRHGFSPDCAADQPPPSKGCAMAACASSSSPAGAAAAAALAALVLAARRRKRR